MKALVLSSPPPRPASISSLSPPPTPTPTHAQLLSHPPPPPHLPSPVHPRPSPPWSVRTYPLSDTRPTTFPPTPLARHSRRPCLHDQQHTPRCPSRCGSPLDAPVLPPSPLFLIPLPTPSRTPHPTAAATKLAASGRGDGCLDTPRPPGRSAPPPPPLRRRHPRARSPPETTLPLPSPPLRPTSTLAGSPRWNGALPPSPRSSPHPPSLWPRTRPRSQ